jgi:UDP-N-acetylmuramoylalanine--D-glutamate ligase
MQWSGRRATIMGLGHFGGGVAAARWLARQGAEVTVTDLADQRELADSVQALAGVPIARFRLGGHREADFRGVDLVVVNPAVRPKNPLVEIARRSGARLATEIELFLEACPACTIGVTGSNGKSTTAAMTAAILQAHGQRAWLGGNIGTSLLDRLDEIGAADWVVLELSSFQLQSMSPGAAMPHVAVVTNCSPNHLDWHGGYAGYKTAKQRLLAGQTPADAAVLNTADAEVSTWARFVQGRCLPLVAEREIPPLGVPGEHNRRNAVCAATAAAAAGCPPAAVWQGLASFRSLEQRLELTAVIAGRRIYNDSASTTPESTIAGLLALGGPGGRDKGADVAPLAEAIAEHTCGAAFFGAVRMHLHRDVAARAPRLPTTAVETLDEALRWCWDRSRPGESIVLSPAFASQDQFQNYRARGERFAALVCALSDRFDERR